MRLITNKSKNLLYRISSDSNTTIQFSTSYAVVTQTIADTYSSLSFKLQGYKNNPQGYTEIFYGEVISSTGVFTKTFTTPSTTGFDLIRFGLNGAKYDTCANCKIDLKPSTTYTFTCNFTNITQGSVSWKDMMLVEGSTAGEYEPYSYNLLNKWQYPATQTVNGVVITNNNDGSYTFDGTATDNSYFNYYVLGKDLRGGVVDGSISNGYYAKDVTYDRNNGIAYYYFSKDTIFNNTLIIPQLYDLTLMYGAGNEPTTVDQFYADHPELKVSPLGFIELKNIEINNKNIKRLRYKTWNNSLNLIDKNDFKSSEIVSGVTFTNNGDGSWTLNGTSTSQIYWDIINSYIQLNTSHKYLLLGCPENGTNDLFLYVNNGGTLFSFDTGSGSIGTPTKNSGIITIAISNNMSVNNAIFKPQLYDLTEIYGAGKEPTTVEQFYKDHPLVKTSPLGFSDLGIIPSNSGIH